MLLASSRMEWGINRRSLFGFFCKFRRSLWEGGEDRKLSLFCGPGVHFKWLWGRRIWGFFYSGAGFIFVCAIFLQEVQAHRSVSREYHSSWPPFWWELFQVERARRWQHSAVGWGGWRSCVHSCFCRANAVDDSRYLILYSKFLYVRRPKASAWTN